MSTAPMLPVLPTAPIDYRSPETLGKLETTAATPPKRALTEPQADPLKIAAISPPPKPASDGFSTPPGFVGTFKAPLSVPPSSGFATSSANFSPTHTSLPLQDNHSRNQLQQQRQHQQRHPRYGSPGTPEVEDLEFDTSKGKVTLWQFLLQLLLDARYSDIIRWTNNAGEFVLLRAEEVARLWGLRKDNNHRMNYDKLSRALRYYYQKNIIRKVQGYKFVYKFIGLQRFKAPESPYSGDNASPDVSYAFEDVKPFRKPLTTTRPSTSALPITSTECLNGFFRYRRPSFSEQHSARPPSACKEKPSAPPVTSSEVPHFGLVPTPPSPLPFGLGFPPPPPPYPIGGPTDFSKLFLNLHKNENPPKQFPHPSTVVDDNVNAIASLACREVIQALMNTQRQQQQQQLQQSNGSTRSQSPKCPCSCHGSERLSPPTEPQPPHFPPPPNMTQRKPGSAGCWQHMSRSDSNGYDEVSSDHQSYLHWQRHIINMNRLKEQIQRVSGSEEKTSPPMLRQCEDQIKKNGNENFIWMPIHVDLVGQIMAMLAQQTSNVPPLAHTSTR